MSNDSSITGPPPDWKRFEAREEGQAKYADKEKKQYKDGFLRSKWIKPGKPEEAPGLFGPRMQIRKEEIKKDNNETIIKIQIVQQSQRDRLLSLFRKDSGKKVISQISLIKSNTDIKDAHFISLIDIDEEGKIKISDAFKIFKEKELQLNKLRENAGVLKQEIDHYIAENVSDLGDTVTPNEINLKLQCALIKEKAKDFEKFCNDPHAIDNFQTIESNYSELQKLFKEIKSLTESEGKIFDIQSHLMKMDKIPDEEIKDVIVAKWNEITSKLQNAKTDKELEHISEMIEEAKQVDAKILQIIQANPKASYKSLIHASTIEIETLAKKALPPKEQCTKSINEVEYKSIEEQFNKFASGELSPAEISSLLKRANQLFTPPAITQDAFKNWQKINNEMRVNLKAFSSFLRANGAHFTKELNRMEVEIEKLKENEKPIETKQALQQLLLKKNQWNVNTPLKLFQPDTDEETAPILTEDTRTTETKPTEKIVTEVLDIKDHKNWLMKRLNAQIKVEEDNLVELTTEIKKSNLISLELKQAMLALIKNKSKFLAGIQTEAATKTTFEELKKYYENNIKKISLALQDIESQTHFKALMTHWEQYGNQKEKLADLGMEDSDQAAKADRIKAETNKYDSFNTLREITNGAEMKKTIKLLEKTTKHLTAIYNKYKDADDESPIQQLSYFEKKYGENAAKHVVYETESGQEIGYRSTRQLVKANLLDTIQNYDRQLKYQQEEALKHPGIKELKNEIVIASNKLKDFTSDFEMTRGLMPGLRHTESVNFETANAHDFKVYQNRLHHFITEESAKIQELANAANISI